MDAEELGMLSSTLAGGWDWSSIKQRGAVTCVLSCLKGAGERGNHSANPLPSEPEHLQGWGGKDVASACIAFSPGIPSGSHSSQETGQSWKPLGYLKHPFGEVTYTVLRLPGLQQRSKWLFKGSHATTQTMEGVAIPHLLSLHAPEHSSSQIWGLHAATSASRQGLVTLIALVASAPVHPHCPNQLKGVGSDASVSRGESSGCEVGGPDAASREPVGAKGVAGTGRGAIPTSRLSECCTAWFPRTAGGEVKGEREELPPRNPVPR